MNKPYPKSNNVFSKTSFVYLIVFIAIIFNSCKKESHTTTSHIIADPWVEKAKKWYENTYPEDNIGKQFTQAITTKTDFSQVFKPNWEHAASYLRFNKNIIEMSIDSNTRFQSALMKGASKSNKAYTRNYLLLFNDGKEYKAYVMMIIADTSYIKNDLTKLSRNTYRKHDADFSGTVLYFTPKGEYVNGYVYKQGQLTTLMSTNQKVVNKRTPSINDNRKKVTEGVECYEWYLVRYEDGEEVSREYLGTTCTNNSGGGLPTGIGPPSSTPDPGFYPPLETPDFGLDDPDDCLNCRIDDSNFDALLNYVESVGLTITDPFNTVLTINGIDYTGQITEIRNSDGKIVANYFSPDVTSGPFQVGIEYTIGNKGPDGSSTDSGSAPNGVILYFGNIVTALGGHSTYSPIGSTDYYDKYPPTILPIIDVNLNTEDALDNGTYTNGNYDTNTYLPYQQSNPWPFVNTVIPRLLFKGMLTNNENCLKACERQIAVMKYQISKLDAPGQTIQVYKENQPINLQATKDAVAYLQYALANKIPVIAGVSNVPGGPNLDNSTNHWIVIVGSGTDSNGKYFRFYDGGATNQVARATSVANKLYYNPTNGEFKGTSDTNYGAAAPYQMTMIRKSKKIL